jgi:hypothetical protein
MRKLRHSVTMFAVAVLAVIGIGVALLVGPGLSRARLSVLGSLGYASVRF